MDLREQNFGLELEFTGITREQAADVIAEHFGTNKHYVGGSYYKYVIPDNNGRKWQVMYDSSIRASRRGGYADDTYKCELVSPICKYEDIKTIQQLVRKLRHKGGKTNDSCGIHVHIDGTNHNAKSLTNLSYIMYAKEDILYRALDIKYSREGYCQKTDKSFIERLQHEKPQTIDVIRRLWYNGRGSSSFHYDSSRYHCLNLHSYFSKGTVEFRCYNSTLHAGKVKSYIQFSLAVSAQAINQHSARTEPTRSSNECYTFRTWLIRIGLNGKEFESCRLHMLSNLEGAKDWKDKEAAMRRRAEREAHARELMNSVNELRNSSPENNGLTVADIISRPDAQIRTGNDFTIREQLIMLLEEIQDNSITPDERATICDILGYDRSQQPQTGQQEPSQTVRQPVGRNQRRR